MKSFIISIFLMLSTNIAFALEEQSKVEPETIVVNILAELDKQLKQNISEKKLDAFIENNIIPKVDFEEISKWVAGRNAWNNSRLQQKDQFVKAIKKYVISQYKETVRLLKDYNYKVEPTNNNHKTRHKVTLVLMPKKAGPEIVISFLLKNEDTYGWLLYDIIVEGISMLDGFRAVFSEDVKKNGMDYITNKINND